MALRASHARRMIGLWGSTLCVVIGAIELALGASRSGVFLVGLGIAGLAVSIAYNFLAPE